MKDVRTTAQKIRDCPPEAVAKEAFGFVGGILATEVVAVKEGKSDLFVSTAAETRNRNAWQLAAFKVFYLNDLANISPEERRMLFEDPEIHERIKAMFVGAWVKHTKLAMPDFMADEIGRAMMEAL